MFLRESTSVLRDDGPQLSLEDEIVTGVHGRLRGGAKRNERKRRDGEAKKAGVPLHSPMLQTSSNEAD